MNILNLSWKNSPLLLSAVVMNLTVGGGFFFQFPEAYLVGDIDKSFIHHCVHAVFLFLGYLIAYIKHNTYSGIHFTEMNKVENVERKAGLLSLGWTLFLYILIALGTYCSIETISHIQNLGDYFTKIGNNEKVERGVEIASIDGGVSGLIKIASYTSLGVYSFLIHRIVKNSESDKSERILFFVSTFCIIIKTIFTLDRLSLIFAIIGLLITKNMGGRYRKLISIVFLSALVFVTIAISVFRISQEGIGGMRFVFLYSRLGLENFEITLDSNVVTWGSNSFLTPILFLLDRSGFFYYKIPETDFVWNPAQYSYSHLFLDFRYASFFVVMLYGWFSARLDAVFRENQSNIASCTIVLWATNTISGISIMWIRSVDFYFILALSVFLTYFHKILLVGTRRSNTGHKGAF